MHNGHDYPIVSLNRRFLPIDEPDLDDEPNRGFLLAAEGKELGVDWPELLKRHDAAVILGEPGAGKTAECRQCAAFLRESDVPAFVLRLEKLRTSSIRSSLDFYDTAGAAAYETWQFKGGRAVVFLDALDEARLPEGRSGAALGDALTNLVNEVGDRGRELQIVLSSRGSEWKGNADERVVTSALQRLRHSRGSGAELSEPRVSVYRIARLDVGQVSAIAKSRNADPDAFLKAVDNAQAADLARQPLEVHFLLDVWLEDQAAGRPPIFGSRTEIFSRVIDFRLTDRAAEESRVVIPLCKLRRGAQSLAAVALLTGRRDIRIGQGNAEEIDAAAVLSAAGDPWQDNEVRQLLATALFHPAIAGRIRFAHRELQDFLAAGLFSQALENYGGEIELIESCFARGWEQRFVSDDMAKAIGWLAAMNSDARREIIQVSPSLLISAGDPRALSVDDRTAALQAHVASYGDRRWRGKWFFTRDVERFASPELAPAVEQLLSETTAPEARRLLVDLARHGQMTGLSSLLAEIVANRSEDTDVRVGAADGVAIFGSDNDRRKVLFAIKDEPLASSPDGAASRNKLVVAAVAAAYPTVVGLHDALALIETLDREPRNLSTATGDRLANIISASTEPSQWLENLVILAADLTKVEEHQLTSASERYHILTVTIAALTTRILNDREPYSPTLRFAIEYLARASEDLTYHLHHTARKEFLQALAGRVDVKTSLLMDRISELPGKPWRAVSGATYPWRYFQRHTEIALFTSADIDAFAMIILRDADERRACAAFELASYLCLSLEPSERDEALVTLWEAARRSMTSDLRRRWRSQRLPSLRRALSRFRGWRHLRLGLHRILRRFKRARTWSLNLTRILLWRASIRDGSNLGVLGWAVSHADNHPAPSALDWVREQYGNTIAGWFRDGFGAAWRKMPVPTESTAEVDVLIGLTGLAAEASERPMDLNPVLAQKAIAYAAIKAFGGFPDWLESLANRHPEKFQELIRTRIDVEMRQAATPGDIVPGNVLSHVRYGAQSVKNLAAPVILSALDEFEPQNLKVLECMTEIVVASPTASPKDVAELARRRFDISAEIGEWSHAWLWLIAWLHVDGAPAWEEVEQKNSDDWSTLDENPLFSFFGVLGERLRHSAKDGSRRANYLGCADVLASMVYAAWLAVPPDRDPRHEDIYSPEAHDYAVEARRALVEGLTSLGTKQARDALVRLANTPVLSRYADYFQYAADNATRSAARRRILSPDEAISLIKKGEFSPATLHEFADRVKAHIKSSLNRLRDSDDDEARGLRGGNHDEDDLRNWLSGRLRDLGRGVYEPYRDQLVAESKRPDIRLTAYNTTLGCISIECKLAERWSGEDLVKLVDEQLVKQYMRDAKSHSGFYVLVRCTPEKESWELSGNRITFADLISHVKLRAREIQSNRCDVEILDVASCDLTKNSA